MLLLLFVVVVVVVASAATASFYFTLLTLYGAYTYVHPQEGNDRLTKKQCQIGNIVLMIITIVTLERDTLRAVCEKQ